MPSDDGKYPLRRDGKSTKQRSIVKIYCKEKHAKTPKKGFAFSTY
jgi:hypothetical protein